MNFIHQHVNPTNTVYRLIDGFSIVVGLLTTLFLDPDLNSKATIVVCLATIGIFSLVSEFTGMYRNWMGSRLAREVGCAFMSWTATLLGLVGLGYFSEYTTELSVVGLWSWFAITPILAVSFRVLYRMFVRIWSRFGVRTKNFAVIGVDELGFQIARNISKNPELNETLFGFFDDRPQERLPEIPEDLPRLRGSIDELVAKAKAGEIDTVYISLPMRAESRINKMLTKLGDSTANVYIVPNFFVFRLLHSRWSDINGLPVVSLHETPIYGVDSVVKRLADIALASIGIVVAAIPMFVIALLIKLTSKGPVLFKQKRYGLDGKEILVWKFRSMTVTENGSVVKQATKNDTRVTAVGKIIRRTSLDELPQFFNVLLGTMSMVGPRPHASAHNEEYRGIIDGYMLRHKIKPGITGLAQVNGCRGETDTIDKMERRVRFDHRYIQEWSIWLDFKIIFKTFFAVFADENAY